MTDEADVVVELPESLRGELKEPMGPVYTDPQALLAHVEGQLVAVGDIVTYHFERIGVSPDVAIVDGRTKRKAIEAEVRTALETSVEEISVRNPPGTLSADLLTALRDLLDSDEQSRLNVEGEEDLATLAAILVADVGASVVYGQPDEGMVHVVVTDDLKAEIANLTGRMDGDPDRLFSILGFESN